MDPGAPIVSEVDGQSRPNSIGCHRSEIPGSNKTSHKVIPINRSEKIQLTGSRWEKAHYYLGKHYNKILDSEKAKPLGKEAQI